MSDGSGALNDVYAKLDWATTPHDEMLDRFEEFAKPGGGDERPYGIKFHEHDQPGGLVVARFIVEEPMPVEMSLLAADLAHNTRAALDHVLARLKDRFGGDASRRSSAAQEESPWSARGSGAACRSAMPSV